MKKTFQERISAFTAAQIAAATGCPKSTAYDWLNGRRQPPAWQQDDMIARIKANAPKAAKAS